MSSPPLNPSQWDDLGASPRKRTRLASQLGNLFDERSDEMPDIDNSSDLLKLQMAVIANYHDEIEKLRSTVERLEKELARAQDENRDEALRRAELIQTVVRRRGLDMRRQGEFLVSLADAELKEVAL